MKARSKGTTKTPPVDDTAAPAARPAIPERWWDRFELAEDEWRRWRIGPLALWIRRFPKEWKIAFEHLPAAAREVLEVGRRMKGEEPGAEAEVLRVAGETTPPVVRLSPTLGDRSIVARPEVPLHLLPGREVALYLEVPVWVRATVGDTDSVLFERPSIVLSKTWFGPSTMEGELCYGAHLAPRLDIDDLALEQPHRAFGKVVLRNLGGDTLVVERISLPAPELALYGDADNRLWIQTLTVTRRGTGAEETVNLAAGPPEQARSAELLRSGPGSGNRNVLVRAISSLLG